MIKIEETQSQNRSKAAKVIDIIRTVFIYILSAGILVAAILFAFNTSPNKSIFGFRYYTILTDSMKPELSVGDLIFVQLKDAENINVNDVITFNPSSDSDAYLTHRVTEKIDDYQGTGVTCFRTKGDANNSEDSFLIDENRVVGTVNFHIPGLGYVVRFFQLRWYIVIPIIIMIFVFFHLLKVYFSYDKKKEEKPEENTEKITEENTSQ
ncbi:MAG: signal peptidase I [Acutalibacteraceae bacterium]